MKYVFASVAGICGAVLFGIAGTWLLVQVMLLRKMSQARGQVGVEFVSLNAAWMLPLGLIGFAVAFYSTLRKLRSVRVS